MVSQKKGGFVELLRLPLRKLLALAMTLTALSQLSGINGVIFYGPTIMKSAGIVTEAKLIQFKISSNIKVGHSAPRFSPDRILPDQLLFNNDS